MWADHEWLRNGRRATGCVLAISHEMDKEWKFEIIFARRLIVKLEMTHKETGEKFRVRCTFISQRGSYNEKDLTGCLGGHMEQDIIMGDFNWRGDKAMQQTIGGGMHVGHDDDNLMWDSRADKRDEGIFAHLLWGLQRQPPRPPFDGGHMEECNRGEMVQTRLHLDTGQLELRRHGLASGSSHLRHGPVPCDCEGMEDVGDLLQDLPTCRRAGPRRQTQGNGVEKCGRNHLMTASDGDAKQRLDAWSQVLHGNMFAALGGVRRRGRAAGRGRRGRCGR